MTDHPTQAPEGPQAPQEQPQDPRIQAWTEAAMAQEAEAAMAAALKHLQNRVIALNVEVRVRDEAIATLEQEKAALERRLNDFLVAEPTDDDGAEVPHSGDQAD